MLCIVSDKNLQCLAAALNRDELLEDPRFIRGQRHLNFDQLVSEVEKWSTTLSCEACETALNQAGVPCSIYQRTEDLFVHPQVVDRNSFTTLTNDELGTFLIQNMPIKFSHIDTTAASWVARLGEHTDEVLAEKLNLQQSEIDALRTSKVIS